MKIADFILERTLRGGKPLKRRSVAIIVPHTHWDREWYLTFQEYRHRLVMVLDKAIEVLVRDPRFRVFMLDGQVAALEDYLAVRPQNESVVRHLVTSGRLIIGPLYTQPDEFLVSEEALIRNFLFGMKRASRYGGYMKVAYLPDTFGHTAQLPQIISGLGMDGFFFMRGLGDEENELGTEFIWEAPDGSRVIAVYLAENYCNANMLGVLNERKVSVWRAPGGWYTVFLESYFKEPDPDPRVALERIKDLARRLLPRGSSKALLLLNGCDHRPLQSKLPDILEEIERELDLDIRIGSLEDYLKLLRPLKGHLKVYRGELRGAKSKPLLAGVLSTRPYLKSLNYWAQLLLEKYAEPLATLASVLRDWRYPSELLDEAWRLLLLNHAHDSIYGSGTDPAHLENEARFIQVLGIASSVAYEAIRRLTEEHEGCGGCSLFVFNPLSWPRKDVALFLVPNHLSEKHLVVVDENGCEYPVQIVASDEYYEGYSLAAACVRAPPVGYSLLRVREGRQLEVKTDSGTVIENEFFRVEADPARGGALRVVDKQAGYVYEALNVFVSEGDVGDEYNYSPPREHDEVVESTGFKATVRRTIGPVFSRLTIRVEMEVPAEAEGQSRSKRRVKLPVTTEIFLYSGVPRIDVRTTVFNVARDHRFRVKFPSGVKTEHSVAETHFYAIKRPIKHSIRKAEWVEKPPSTHPQLSWVSVSDGRRGLTIANRGIPEYEVGEEGGQAVVYLTLFRSIGWLSRDDLQTRKGHAGPPIRTPGAQCIREMTFEYSLIPHRGDWLTAGSFRYAREFYQPLLASLLKGEAAYSYSLAEVRPNSLVLTALKKAELGEGVVLRFFNISGKEAEAEVLLGFRATKAWMTDLKERLIKPLGSGERLRLQVKPFKIVTVLLVPERKGSKD